MAFSLPLPLTQAQAKPDPATEQKKLTKLNEQADVATEKYNQASENLKAAKKKLDAAKKANKAQQKVFDEQRKQIVELAATAYKNGNVSGVTGFIGSGDPQKVLDQSAFVSQLSANRDGQIAQYVAAAQRMTRQQAQAQSAYDDVAAKAKDLRSKKADVDKAVAKQKRLLAKLGRKTPTGGGTGGTYTGPASGNARTALNFAYAQLGKPYVSGAEGPNSYDCSGLTMASWAAAGVNITRTTYTQWSALSGHRVTWAQLQPGDLIFFNNLAHVGMYVGGGKMIHSPHTGSVVQIVSLSGYYQSTVYGAARP
ncbi:C40 family peptidase [Actinomadura sp. PM05-2]|uniref:C40 family peptidase n=1 Tax=Actinomadura parmotrematis TaxID=2864039 RepID=A0ABS7FKD9_9ACTN|nr:C40 family peptidase [Actinomadura parmotrematis]